MQSAQPVKHASSIILASRTGYHDRCGGTPRSSLCFAKVTAAVGALLTRIARRHFIDMVLCAGDLQGFFLRMLQPWRGHSCRRAEASWRTQRQRRRCNRDIAEDAMQGCVTSASDSTWRFTFEKANLCDISPILPKFAKTVLRTLCKSLVSLRKIFAMPGSSYHDLSMMHCQDIDGCAHTIASDYSMSLLNGSCATVQHVNAQQHCTAVTTLTYLYVLTR